MGLRAAMLEASIALDRLNLPQSQFFQQAHLLVCTSEKDTTTSKGKGKTQALPKAAKGKGAKVKSLPVAADDKNVLEALLWRLILHTNNAAEFPVLFRFVSAQIHYPIIKGCSASFLDMHDLTRAFWH